MNAPVDLRTALVQQYYRDPKLAYELVTGACIWPPLDDAILEDRDCFELAGRAANAAYELETSGGSSVLIDQYRAAEEAFVMLERDAENERKLREWAEDEAEPFNPWREYGISQREFV